MNILIIQQYSMRSYKNNEYLFDKDGHTDTMFSLIKGVDTKNFNFITVVPSNIRNGLDSILEYKKLWNIQSNINFTFKEFGVNIDEERSDFPRLFWKDIIENNNIDLVINMNDVITPNLNILRKYVTKKFKIYTVLDHMPFYKESWDNPQNSKFNRILESIDVSDKVFTYFDITKRILEYFSKKTIYCLPAFSSEFLNQFVCNKQDVTLIATRLTENNKINIDAILDHKNKFGMELIICNPNELSCLNVDSKLRNYAIFMNEPSSKIDFLKLLASAKYMLTFFDSEKILSSSTLQAIYYTCETDYKLQYNYYNLTDKQKYYEEKYSIEYNSKLLDELYNI